MLRKTPVLLSIILLLACDTEVVEYERQPPITRTVLVYMAADNDLYTNALQDIEEMQSAILPSNVHLLVYLDITGDSVPKIFEIQNGEQHVLRQYESHNSASGEVLHQIIQDAVSAFPSQSYGLVLWSHGTGWLPAGVYQEIRNQVTLRSFGLDNKQEMSITELENALPLKLDFIIFDACMMSNIETVYQLRHKADIIIASPTETLVAGFPYTEVAPLLFTDNYAEIAQAYMNYYKEKTGILQSASISVIKTQELEPLADQIKNSRFTFPFDKSTIQTYDTHENPVYYDLQDYLEHAENDNITDINQQIARTIVYRDYTPYFLKDLPIEKSCGISLFVFPYPDTELENQYKALDWYNDTQLLCR